MAYSRFFSNDCSRRVARSSKHWRSLCNKMMHNQASSSAKFLHSYCIVRGGGCSSHMSRNVKGLLKNSGLRAIHVSYTSYRLSYPVKAVWRWFSEMYCHNKPTLPPISRMACAVSLSLTRSHLVAPGILALIIGELAWNEGTYAQADYFPKNIFYRHPNDQQFYVVRVLHSILEGLRLIVRALYLAFLFSPCILMAPFADSLSIEFRRSWIRSVRVTLEKAGPAFIKWGQWAAARPDLFPKDLCNELCQLHSKAPAHSFSYTKSTIEKAFGHELGELFDQFEEEPVASGSIAQVHKATLRSRHHGQQAKHIVAVKVRHPGVREAIHRDFVLINLFAKYSRYIPNLKWLRLDESAQQFAVFMMSQVDLAREAANLSRFIYNFRHSKDVSFPKPIYPLVHPAVLVESYESGSSILYYVDKFEGQGQVKTALAHIGTTTLLKMLLVDNFIHADLHPGNILVKELKNRGSGKPLFNSKPSIILLDVGMTAELSKKDRNNLLKFFKAVALRDGRTAAECTLKLSDDQNCPSPEAFIKEVDVTFKAWNSIEAGFVHPSDCMQQLLEQVRRHKVNIDGNICAVIVTTMVLEGWQRKLDPTYDVMQTLKAILFKVDLADSLYHTLEGVMAP